MILVCVCVCVCVCVFLQNECPPFFCFPSVRYRKSKVVTSYSTGTMAQWPGGNFYNHLDPLLVYFFVFEKEMFPFLKTRVNGARYRSPEGSL